MSPSSFDTITAEALEAYKLYVVEVRHPVEVPGNERPHMTQWLIEAARLSSSTFPICESIGLKLVGGRLLPGPTGAAAAFYMYEGTSGERFTIYCAGDIAGDGAALQGRRSLRRLLLGGRQASPMW